MMYDLSSVVEKNIWGPFDAFLKTRNSGHKSYEFLELFLNGESVTDDWRDLIRLAEIFSLFMQGKLYRKTYARGTLSIVLSPRGSTPRLVIRTQGDDTIEFDKVDAGTFVQVARKLLNYCMLF